MGCWRVCVCHWERRRAKTSALPYCGSRDQLVQRSPRSAIRLSVRSSSGRRGTSGSTVAGSWGGRMCVRSPPCCSNWTDPCWIPRSRWLAAARPLKFNLRSDKIGRYLLYPTHGFIRAAVHSQLNSSPITLNTNSISEFIWGFSSNFLPRCWF